MLASLTETIAQTYVHLPNERKPRPRETVDSLLGVLRYRIISVLRREWTNAYCVLGFTDGELTSNATTLRENKREGVECRSIRLNEQTTVHIELSSDIPTLLRQDARRGIELILADLTMNCIQAINGLPGVIFIQGKVNEDRKNLTLKVSDTGPGWPEDIARGWNESGEFRSHTGGNGISSSTIRNFITSIGGRVSAGNNKAIGACLSICLPLKSLKDNRKKPAKKPPRKKAAKKRK